jgi:toxin ParE1/3/4
MSQVWHVRLTQQAERDLHNILKWTAERFGAIHAENYAETLMSAIEALSYGPDIPGIKNRDELAPGVRVLHVARYGRKGRHFVVFRGAEEQVVEVLRLLHDSMELTRYMSASND